MLLCDRGHLLQFVSPAFGGRLSHFDSGKGVCTVPRKHAIPNTVQLGPISNMTLQTTEKSKMSEYYWNKTNTTLPLHKGTHRV